MTQLDPTVDPRVQASRDAWRATRHGLNANRLTLAKLAAQAYPASCRFEDTGLVAGPGWIPEAPVEIDQVALTLEPNAPSPALDGTERESGHVRPACTLTKPYPRYTKAVAELDRPRLFESRPAWRFTGLDWDSRSMAFAPTSYFAAVDVNEVLAHETALVCLDEAGQPNGRAPRLGELPYRRLVGDPFDFARRPVMPAVSTLTIRGGDKPSFILHRRDSRSVAMAGDTLQVIPSGIFQPSSVLGQASDFSLVRNFERELAEELLGFDEADGDGRPVRYDLEPFATFDAAIADGRMRLHVLGVALDALTLVGEILTVAVLDPDLFDDLARDFVEVNEEGTVVGERQAFTVEGVGGLLSSGRMAPAGAGCLSLAWRQRGVLLG